MKRLIFTLFLMLFASLAIAQTYQPLPVGDVFQLTAKTGIDNTVLLNWKILNKHFLYRERFKFKVIEPNTASVGTVILPRGEPREEDLYGKYQVFTKQVTIPIPIIPVTVKDVELKVEYQGCADAGYCYPPTTQLFNVNFTEGTVAEIAPQPDVTTAPVSEQSRISQILDGGHLFTILLAFLGFGLLLSFTPCVLPMIPILSGIILGHKEKMTTRKAFLLSSVYVLAMSFTYAMAGILFSFMGGTIQAAMQKPWLLTLFSLIFVAMALSLFGLYEINLPKRFEAWLANISNKQKGGSFVGVAIMGVLATLIVSPCVTAPLVGALAYISVSGNAMLGGMALFTMGIGMGIPLIIIGTAHGKLLPKAGPWMDTIKSVLGVLMIAVAIYMLERILPGPVSLLLWAVLLIVSAVYMGAFKMAANKWQKLWKGIALVMLAYGVTLVIGASMGNQDPFQPLLINHANNTAGTTQTNSTGFKRIKSIADVNQALANAKREGKPTMLDFYADWCISCKQMEYKTFGDPKVKALMNNFQLLQADVTANDATDKALEKQFGVVAPPSIIFFDKQGKEIKGARIVGDMGPKPFLSHLQNVLTQ